MVVVDTVAANVLAEMLAVTKDIAVEKLVFLKQAQ